MRHFFFLFFLLFFFFRENGGERIGTCCLFKRRVRVDFLRGGRKETLISIDIEIGFRPFQETGAFRL